MCRFLNIKRLKICKVLDYISEYCKCHKLLSYWSAGVFLSCIFHFPNVWNPFSVMWQNCPIWYVCQQWMIFMSSQREYKRQERKYTPVYRRCRHTQGWWPFSTNFFCISKKEKSGVLFRLWWLFADSPFGFLVLQIFPVERRENFHSSWCNNLWLWCKRSFVHQKGSLFGSWCTPCVGAESTDPWCGASAAGVNLNYLSGALRSLGSGAYTNPTTTHQASCFTRESSRNLWNSWCFELFEVLRIIWVTFGNKLHAVGSNLCRNPPSWGLGGEAEVSVKENCSRIY